MAPRRSERRSEAPQPLEDLIGRGRVVPRHEVRNLRILVHPVEWCQAHHHQDQQRRHRQDHPYHQGQSPQHGRYTFARHLGWVRPCSRSPPVHRWKSAPNAGINKAAPFAVPVPANQQPDGRYIPYLEPRSQPVMAGCSVALPPAQVTAAQHSLRNSYNGVTNVVGGPYPGARWTTGEPTDRDAPSQPPTEKAVQGRRGDK